MTVDRSTMVKTPILLFVIYGFWCPLWWSSKWKFVYYCYTIVSIVLLITHMLTQLLNVIFNIDNVTELAGNCLSLMPTIDACAKATNILMNRQKIIALLNMFENDRFKLQNYREINIQRNYEKLLRWINIGTIILFYSTISYMLIRPFVRNIHSRQLPFLAWYPYAIDTELNFWSTYTYEIVSTPFVGLVELANVLLTISLMGQISMQLDILGNRLVDLARSNVAINAEEQLINVEKKGLEGSWTEKRRRELVYCINHHLFIFELADGIQRCFVATFSIQMLVSLVGICTGAYQLARSSVGSPEFGTAVLFITCMLLLAFPCCWFGNEVYLKSLDIGTAVYNMDWTSLELVMQKDLLNICMRAKRPILFASGPAVPLSNGVFMGILQASYTAFTVLQRADGRSTSS